MRGWITEVGGRKPEVRGPQLNSLRSSSSKNLTGPLNGNGKIIILCVLCVSSEAGGEYKLTNLHIVAGKWKEIGKTATLEFRKDGTFKAVDNQGMAVKGKYTLIEPGNVRFEIF